VTRAERLRARAEQLDDTADRLRWSEPTEARALHRVACDLRDIAAHLPPERTDT
jgi:hypothetical protein